MLQVKFRTALALLAHTIEGHSSFGPNQCVSVSQNPVSNTCILQTNCPDNGKTLQLLEQTDFAFACVNSHSRRVQKHSFGKGGFSPKETYDTEVKCDSCKSVEEVRKTNFLAPSPAAASGEVSSTLVQTRTDSQNTKRAGKKKSAPADSIPADGQPVSYGPSSCIITYIKLDNNTSQDPKANDGELGTCFVRTQCNSVAKDVFENYPMGVIAVDKNGVPTRHLFGANSFDAVEEFGTLIRATKCLGLDQTSEAVTLEAEVKALSKVTYDLKAEVAQLQNSNGQAMILVSKTRDELQKENSRRKKAEGLVEKEKIELGEMVRAEHRRDLDLLRQREEKKSHAAIRHHRQNHQKKIKAESTDAAVARLTEELERAEEEEDKAEVAENPKKINFRVAQLSSLEKTSSVGGSELDVSLADSSADSLPDINDVKLNIKESEAEENSSLEKLADMERRANFEEQKAKKAEEEVEDNLTSLNEESEVQLESVKLQKESNKEAKKTKKSKKSKKSKLNVNESVSDSDSETQNDKKSADLPNPFEV